MFSLDSLSATDAQTLSNISSPPSVILSSLSPRKIQILQSTPKYNAHCHLGGEIPLSVLEKYGTVDQLIALKVGLDEIKKGKDYEKAFFIFPLITQLMNTLERLKEGTYETCERMKKDNIQLVLMRTGLKSIQSASYEDYLKFVLAGIEQASSENFKVLLMLSLKRSSTPEMAKMTVDLALNYRSKGVIGIDISDQSTLGDINVILPELIRGKENGLKIAVHMGESPHEKDQMLIINMLKPDLIDHGVNLCEEASEWIERNHISVTVCLTSSEATKMHSKNKSHPWITTHLRNQHPIDLGTDDSTVFGNITLTGEFARLGSELEFDKIIQIARASFDRAKEWFDHFK